MNHTTITLSLKPHLADFCRHEFKTTPTDEIILTRHHDFGKLISSLVRESDFPLPAPQPAHPVTFVLPRTANNHYQITHRFCYIDTWAAEKIHDFIDTEFRRRIRDMFEIGYAKKLTQKEIIEAILLGYNIRNNALNFEAIKKIDYRRRQRFRKSVFEELQAAVF